MEKEYLDKKNSKRRVKSIPLYGNYIFLKYEQSPEILNLLIQNQLFYRYLGECTSDEAKRIEEFKFRNYKEFFDENDLEIGMCVKLVKDPFNDRIGRVKSISGQNILVVLECFGHLMEVRCKLDDLRTELWSADEGI
jgi:transcription antitermination factor NusG